MHGHQLDRLLPRSCVAVGKQRDVGQIIFKRTFLTAGVFVFIDRLLELGQIVQPLLAALGTQHLLIAALVQQRTEHLGNRLARIVRGKIPDQANELRRLGRAEQLVLQVALQGLVE